jgi:hypothetical protein
LEVAAKLETHFKLRRSLPGLLEKTDDADDQLCRKYGGAKIGQQEKKVSLARIKTGEDSAHGTPPPAETFLSLF